MVDDLHRNSLQRHVGEMIAEERQMEELLTDQAEDVAAHPQAAQLIARLQSMARAQREALEARLQSIGGKVGSGASLHQPFFAREAKQDRQGSTQSVSRALQALYAASNHATIGYARLHAVAHRCYDSMDEGNTAGLAEAHLRGYAATAQEINQLISDVVVWELGREGLECQCQCPSCGLGLCLCAPHGTITVNQAWRETTPSVPDQGVRVRLPRAESAAARAGVRENDTIIAVNDQEIAAEVDVPTIQAMQGAVRKHKSGEEILLRVRRTTGEQEEIRVTIP